MQPPLSYREVSPCLMPGPHLPWFSTSTPNAPNTGSHLGEFPARGSQPWCPLCHGRTRHKGLAHRDTGQLPCSPCPSSPQHHPVRPRHWKWHPKGGGGRRRGGTHPNPPQPTPTHPWALLLGTVPAGWGAPPKHGPLGCYQENRWQPALARGQAWERGGPPAPRGREQSLGISFLAGPGCPPL